MGGAVSAGEDNDELVDKLVNAHYVKHASTEQVLRAVDRGHFVVDAEQRNTAYKDLAWKSGHLHVSAPCIYSEVLDGLDIKPGMSVLNLGSGTGYLSTLFGLLIGRGGANDGVELHADVVAYAEAKVEALMEPGPRSPLTLFPFTRPRFIVGNILALKPVNDVYGPYDRLYCGAAVPEEDNAKPFVLSFLKLGGVAVLPFGDQLQQIRVIGPGQYETRNLMSVSFATLVPSPPENKHSLILPPGEVDQLQSLCREEIRSQIRAWAQSEKEVKFKDLVSTRWMLFNHVRLELEDHAESECGTGGTCQRRLAKRRRRLQRAVMPMLQVAIVSRDHRRGDGHFQPIPEDHIASDSSSDDSGDGRMSLDRVQFRDLITRTLQLNDEDQTPPRREAAAKASSDSSTTEDMHEGLSDSDPEPQIAPPKAEEMEEELKDGIDAAMPDTPDDSDDSGVEEKTNGKRSLPLPDLATTAPAASPYATAPKRRPLRRPLPLPPRLRTASDSSSEDEAETAAHEARGEERAAKEEELGEFYERFSAAIHSLPLPPNLRAYLSFTPL